MNNQDERPEILANRLDEVLKPGERPGDTHSDDPLVTTALRLADAPHPELSPDAMLRIQMRFLGARKQRRAQPATHKIRYLNPVYRWAVAASITILLFTSGLTSAMAQSAPGDVFYPIKRFIEPMELGLTTNDTARANVYLNQAARRVEEALILLERNTFDSTLVAETVTNLVYSTRVARRAPETDIPIHLESRTVQINTLLNGMLQDLSSNQQISADILTELTDFVQNAQNSNTLLLPESIIPTPRPSLKDIVSDTPSTSDTELFTTALVRAPQAINVRNGPGMDFDRQSVLQPGAEVQVLGKNQDSTWLHVQFEGQSSGWVFASLLRVNTA
jgi:hypothetical protein